MQNAPSFIAPLVVTDASSSPDESLWDAAIADYEAENYPASLTKFVKYLDPSVVSGDSVVGSNMKLEHGSVQLQFHVTDSEFSIFVPFLKLPEGGRAIAMMRKAMEVGENLNLSRFVLKEDDLSIQYSDELAGCHPAKLLDIMRCICLVADANDDLFVEQFGATRLNELAVTPWAGEKLSNGYLAYQTIIKEGLELATFWEGKQNLRMAYLSLDMTMERLRWTLSPQGYLRSSFGKFYRQIDDKSKSGSQRISAGKKALEKYLEEPESAIADSLYDAKFILPQKEKVDLAWYQKALGDPIGSAANMRQGKKYQEAVMVYLHNGYEDIRRFQLPSKVMEYYVQGFANAAGKPCREAAEILAEMYANIIGHQEESKKDGVDYYQQAKQELADHSREMESGQ